MSEDSSIRIKDIARMAGVSAGTVDRVLYKRGKVSEATLRKVEEVLDKVGYKPNLIARTLGAKKSIVVSAVLPNPDMDEYWKFVNEGMMQGARDFAHYQLQIKTHFFDVRSTDSFKDQVENLFQDQSDGILLAPVFHNESEALLSEIENRGIPYLLINSDVPKSRRLSFIGQDLEQSGRVAGQLLQLLCPPKANILILHLNEQIDNAIHLKAKENGVREYMAAFGGTVKVLDLVPGEQARKAISGEILTGNIDGIFVSTSQGTALVASIVEDLDRSQLPLVGYDLLTNNCNYLKQNVIDFLINQNPQKMARMGTEYLVNSLLFNKQVPSKVIFPIEIVTSQNLESYLAASDH